MSAIGAIFNFDGAPVVPEKIKALSEDLAARGPDGNFVMISGAVGMCYRPLHTTKESWEETQPVRSSTGDLLVMDGIIFNREELLASLREELDDDHTDVAIMSAGLQRYGTSFLGKVIGNFALVRYDARSRTVLLARDSFALRPIFYHINNSGLIVASDLRALINATDVVPEVDNEYVAGYLAMFPEPTRTPFRNFYAVEPGHAVQVGNGQLKSTLFWKPDENKEVRYSTDAQYEEHLTHLLHESVRSCLRTDGRPIWSGLSGGLDSSSIVCLADQLIEKGDAEATRLDTFSIVYTESVTSDERKYIRAVEEKRGRTGLHLSDDDYWMRFPPPERSFLTIPTALHCVPGRAERLREEMLKSGARVLLNGLGGDHVFWNIPDVSPQLSDFLAQGRLLSLHRSLRTWSKVLSKPYSSVFFKMGLLPCLPEGIRARYQLKVKVPYWIDVDFAKSMQLRKRLLPPADPYDLKQRGRRIQSSLFRQLVWLLASGSYQERDGIEMRSPFLHRELVEFLLLIPFEQKIRPGEMRSLMRRALRNVLPEKIWNRPGKGEISEAMKRGWFRERTRLKEFLTDARIVSLGYVNANALEKAFMMAIHGARVDVGALNKTLALEIWLRSIEQHGVAIAGAHQRSEYVSSQPSLRYRTDAVAP